MQKLPIYLIVFFTLFATLLGAYFLVLYIFDGSTTVVLQTYEITKDQEMVRKHLLAYQGEFEDHNTKINFVSWGIKNPGDFVEITDGFEVAAKERTCGLLAFAATDSGVDKEFDVAFEKYDSECLRMIRTEIDENRKWRQRSETRHNQ